MKTKYITVLLLTVTAFFTGCSEDFLNTPPEDSLVDAKFYQTDAQVMAGTAALYGGAWKDYCDQAYWKIGDVRAGLVFSPWATSPDIRDFTTFNVTGLSKAAVDAYRSFYQVVGTANTVMHNLRLYAGPEVTEDTKNYAMAEARFMRATAYMYLVMTYGAVPIIENNTEHLDKADLKRNTIESVWKFIIKDFRFAAQFLTQQPKEVGRLTQWSAEGMLARTYLNIAGLDGSLNQTYLDSAKYYADHVITESGKNLLPDYANLFKYPYDNNSESLFELQWVFTANGDLSYRASNTMVSQITPDNAISANSDGWGGGLSATSWMLSQYEGLYVDYVDGSSGSPGFTMDQRLKATFMLPGFTYPELISNTTGQPYMMPYNPDTDEPNQGFLNVSIKKYVVGNIPGESGRQAYPNNTYMQRLAEMYLIYAEATVLSNGGSTSDGKALEYFNKVHERAGLQAYTDPLTWDIIFSERVREFAMEGLAWYDLVRLHYYSPQHAYEIINAQERGQFLPKPNQWPNPTAWSFYKTSWFSVDDIVPASAANFIMPLPQVELSQAPSLAEEPVPYEFK